MKVSDAARIKVTTFDAAGMENSSDEWVVEVDPDTVGFWTPHVAPWVERLRLTDVVTVQAASRSGRGLREEPVLEGRAVVVTEGVQLDAVRALTRDKYGLSATITDLVDRAWELGGKRTPEGAVVIHIVG